MTVNDWAGEYEEPVERQYPLLEPGTYLATITSVSDEIEPMGAEYTLIKWMVGTDQEQYTIQQRLYYCGKNDGAHNMAKVNLNKIKRALDMKTETNYKQFIGGKALIEVVINGKYNNINNVLDATDLLKVAAPDKSFNDKIPF
jgi:hypothetical protein